MGCLLKHISNIFYAAFQSFYNHDHSPTLDVRRKVLSSDFWILISELWNILVTGSLYIQTHK